MITGNLVFSKWDQIFKDPMTTAAAVDRVVHQAVIIELNIASYRAEIAKRRPTRGGREREEVRRNTQAANESNNRRWRKFG